MNAGCSGIEAGDNLLDLHPCIADALPTAADEFARPGDTVREAVHVDVVSLKLAQDGLQFLECLGIPEVGCGFRSRVGSLHGAADGSVRHGGDERVAG